MYPMNPGGTQEIGSMNMGNNIYRTLQYYIEIEFSIQVKYNILMHYLYF